MKKGETFEFIKSNIMSSTWTGQLDVCSNMVAQFGIKYQDQELFNELTSEIEKKRKEIEKIPVPELKEEQ